MDPVAAVRRWWVDDQRRCVFLAFVMLAAVSIGGLWNTRAALDTVDRTVANNQALIASADARAERLSDRITELLVETRALHVEVDASHDDVAILSEQIRRLGGEPAQRDRSVPTTTSTTTSTTSPRTVLGLPLP